MSAKIQIVCGHCDSVVALPAERIGDAPRCPHCKAALVGGRPLELTASSFARHIGRNSLPVLIDFWAPWCGPCIGMAPHFEKVAVQLGARLRFAKLNTQDEPGLAGELGIRSIPTLILFKAGQPLARQSGAMDAGNLVRWLEGLKV